MAEVLNGYFSSVLVVIVSFWDLTAGGHVSERLPVARAANQSAS